MPPRKPSQATRSQGSAETYGAPSGTRRADTRRKWLTLERTIPHPARRTVRLVPAALSAEALSRMARFEEFIQRDTERQAQAAENAAIAAAQKLMAQRIDTRATKPSRQEVALLDHALAGDALRFMASARLRRYMLMKP